MHTQSTEIFLQKILSVGYRDPLFISIGLNNYCGLECNYCRREKNTAHIQNKSFMKILDYIKRTKTLTTVILYGGEPFLDSNLERILKVTKSRGIMTSLDTHVNFQNFEKVRNLLDYIGQIRLKINNPIEKVHDKFVNKEGHYKQVMEFILFLNEIGYDKSKVLVYKINEKTPDLGKFIKICEELHCTPNIFLVPREDNRSPLSYNEYWNIVKRVHQAKLNKNNIITDMPVAGVKYPNIRGICPAGRLSLHFDYKGILHPCKYSNISLGRFDNTIAGKDVKNILQKSSKIEKLMLCEKCKHYSICGGGCLGNRYRDTKDFYCPIH